MQHHIEGWHRHLEQGRRLLATLVFQNAQANGSRVAFIDLRERSVELAPRVLSVARVAQSLVDPLLGIALGGVERPFEVLGLKQPFTFPLPQVVERDACGDDAKPRIHATTAPLKGRKTLDDPYVSIGQGILCSRVTPEAGQQHEAVQLGTVAPQERAQSLTITALRGSTKLTFFALKLSLRIPSLWTIGIRSCRFASLHSTPHPSRDAP